MADLTVPPAPRSRRYGSHESRAIREAARLLGCSAAVAGRKVRQDGIHIQVATLIRSALAAGDHQLAERLFAPIEAARMALAPESVTVDLVDAEQRADAEEDLAEVRYLADPSRAHRRALINKLRAQRSRSLELLVALELEEAAS